MNYVFIRGLARNKHHWYGFEKRFDSSSHVIMLDIPGNGEFFKQISNLSIEENTDFLRKQFLKLKMDGPYILVGISLGGMIAIDWLNRYALDFEQVIAINISAKNLAFPWQRFNWKLFFKIPRLIFASDVEVELTILKATLNLKTVDTALLDQALNISDKYKTSTMNFLRQIIAASRFHFPDEVNAKKLIIIYSENDRLVNSISSKKVVEKLNCRYFVHTLAGHDLPLDDSEWLKTTIGDLANVD
jgi:pimeloyl-ACP methyl ester carboxylesterase